MLIVTSLMLLIYLYVNTVLGLLLELLPLVHTDFDIAVAIASFFFFLLFLLFSFHYIYLYFYLLNNVKKNNFIF